MNKVRKSVLWMILALVLPMTQAWAGGGGSSKTYYAALKAQVSSNSSGMGTVYAGTSTEAGSYDDSSSTSSNQSSKTKDEAKTFYAFAKANEGYEFKGWSASDNGSELGTKSPLSQTVECTSTDSNSPTITTLYATFAKKVLPPFAVAFLPAVGGTYTVDGQDMSGGGTSGTKCEVYEPKLVATPAAGYAFNGWYQQDSADGEKVCISRELKIEKGAFTKDAWVSVDFKEIKSAKTCDDLSEMLTGEYPKVVIENGVTVTIPSDKTIVVPTGVTLDVQGTLEINEGTLYVEGSLANSGTITVTGNGTLSKCTKLVVQQGQADGVPFNPYGDKKYWKTSVSTPTVTVPSGVTVTAHAKVVNGAGETFRIALPDSARVLTVTRGASVAENHITGVSSVSTSDDLKNVASSAMFVLLTSDCVINKNTTAKTGFSGYVDCAGQKCSTGSSYEVNGTNGAATFFNCPEFKVSKSVGTTHTFYNCQKVTVSSLNAGNPCGNSFYDCGPTVSINYNKGPANGTYANFYSGTYDSIPTKTQVIYGGRYKTNPGTEGAYLATGKSLQVKQENGYFVVYEQIAIKVAEIRTESGDQTFETLQEAFEAVGNGQTVRLMQNYEANETATVAAGKNFSLELSGYSLLGTSGKIVNNGTLWIKDSATLDATKETSALNWAIENNGQLETTYGTYKGNFTLNVGSRLITHGGRFLNQLILGSGVTDPTAVADLRGGYFSMGLADAGLLSQDYLQRSNWVGKFPYALVENETQSGYEKTWKVTALSPADLSLYAKGQAVRPLPRAEYESDSDWNRRAELESMLKPYSGTLDCTLGFDRPTAEKSVKVYVFAKIPINELLDRTMAANEVYRVLITKMLAAESDYSLFSYDRFLTGYDFTQTATVGVSDVNGGDPGTVAKLELEVCHTTDRHANPQTPDLYAKDFAVATCRYMLGGGKAAIDRESNRVAYNTLAAAVADAQSGETTLVGADTAENVTFAKAGTFTVDPYGFAFTGTVSIDDGFFQKVPAATAPSLALAQGVSSANATTYVVAKKVAQVGEMFYDNLNDAIAVADNCPVRLLADIDLGTAYVTIAKTASVTLDLNGKTLTSAASQTVSISGAGSLTITDTAEGGKIVNTKSTGKAVSGVNGSVALISGTVEGPESAITAKALAVSGGVAKAGNMAVSGGGTISGGTIISTNSYAVDASVSGVTLEITGGTIQGAAAKGDVRVYSGNLKATGIALANVIKFASNASGIILPGTEASLFTAELGIYDGETLVGYAPAQTTGTVGAMEGKTVKLLKDCTTTDALTIGKSCTVDLNGHNLTTSAAVAIAVKGSSTTPSTVTIQGTGTVSSTLATGCNAVQVGSYATLTIADGAYVVPADNAAVYIASSYVTKPSTVTIAGGTYESGDGKYTLNIKDDQVARGATICVTGGAFRNNFNPADNGAEGEHTNFVKDGYVAVEKSTGVWTVVLKPVDITITMDAAATAPIAVDPGWIAEKVGANATAAEIVEKLEAVDVNGFKGWQNYVMGIDGSVEANELKPVEGVATESEKSGKTDPIVIAASFTANNAPAASASKVAVTYKLFKGVMGTNGQVVWGTEPVVESEKPRFAMDFKDTVGDTYWKIAVVFTAVK